MYATGKLDRKSGDRLLRWLGKEVQACPEDLQRFTARAGMGMQSRRNGYDSYGYPIRQLLSFLGGSPNAPRYPPWHSVAGSFHRLFLIGQ